MKPIWKEVFGGGSVMNAIKVAQNAPACMLKLPRKEQGGGCIWDFAATHCIFNELGLSVTDFSGDPLNMNRSNTLYFNDVGVLYRNGIS